MQTTRGTQHSRTTIYFRVLKAYLREYRAYLTRLETRYCIIRLFVTFVYFPEGFFVARVALININS